MFNVIRHDGKEGGAVETVPSSPNFEVMSVVSYAGYRDEAMIYAVVKKKFVSLKELSRVLEGCHWQMGTPSTADWAQANIAHIAISNGEHKALLNILANQPLRKSTLGVSGSQSDMPQPSNRE